MTTKDIPPAIEGNICIDCFKEAGIKSKLGGFATHGTCSICQTHYKADQILVSTLCEQQLILERLSTAEYQGIYYTGRRVWDKVTRALCEKYSGDDLNNRIHELKIKEAEEINNSGVQPQIEYLLKSHGLEWAVDTLLKGE